MIFEKIETDKDRINEAETTLAQCKPATLLSEPVESGLPQALGGEQTRQEEVRIMDRAVRDGKEMVLIVEEKMLRQALFNTNGSLQGAKELLEGKGARWVEKDKVREH